VRRCLVLLFAASFVCLLGCGGGGSDQTSLGRELSYLPKDVTTVVVVSTDVGSKPFKDAGQSLVPAVTDQPPGDIEELLRRAVDSGSDLSYDAEVAPLLGNPIVIGTSDPEGLVTQGISSIGGPDFVVTFETDTGKVRDLLDHFSSEVKKQGEEDGADIYSDQGGTFWLGLNGDVAVVTGERGDLLDALAQADGGDRFTETDFNQALEGLPKDAPVRAYADITRLREIPQVRPLTKLPWFDALRTAGASLTVSGKSVVADAVANTDPAGLKPSDLPLPPGGKTPEIVREKGKISGASINQSQTTAFLLKALQVAFPDSQFVQDVKRVERHLKIDFERQVLRQFNGPSASVLKLPEPQPPVVYGPTGPTVPTPPGEGEFAARSKVGNPARLAGVMSSLARDLGPLVEGLQGLQSEGLAALFLVAPDAPIRPGVLPPGPIKVETIPGQHDFYRISGLAAGVPYGAPTPVPDQVVFGLVGDQFVVGSNLRLAKQIAHAKSRPAEGVSGASVLEADLSTLESGSDNFLAGVPGTVSASLRASLSQLHGELRIKLR
jgi:hypothetical protein